MKMISARIPTLLRRCLARLRGFSWGEVALLVASLVVRVCGFCFIRLADEVKEGETQTFDEWVLRSLRRADDPAVPIGPAWLREAGLDVTALGSPAVLSLRVAAVVGLLWLQGR